MSVPKKKKPSTKTKMGRSHQALDRGSLLSRIAHRLKKGKQIEQAAAMQRAEKQLRKSDASAEADSQ